MTLRDLFTDYNTYEKYGDMDVYNDTTDEMSACWCGTLLTYEGATHYDNYTQFGKLLDTPIEIKPCDYGYCIEVKLDSYPDYNRRWKYIDHVFCDAAGYMPEDEYDRYWFDDYDADGTDEFHLMPQGDPDEDSLERIGKLEDMFSNAMDWIFEHIHPDDVKGMLKRVGYSDREVEQYIKGNL